jgi:hypothetical protein
MSYNDVLFELQDYILNNKNIEKALADNLFLSKNDKSRKIETAQKYEKYEKYEKYDKIEEPKQTNVKPQLNIPKQKDMLFWCYYIIKNGDANYDMLHNKTDLTAKQLKIELVTTIRKNKNIVKQYKFDTITNLESNLANDASLNVKTFLTLCAIENINVVFVNNKTYYELLMNDSDIIYIVYQLDSNLKYSSKFGFTLSTEETLNTIKNTLYQIDKIDKPIKAISSYKVNELIDMCNKLGIQHTNTDTQKNKSKKDMYESIIQYF